MYLRTGWVVGNAGLGGAILIILLAHVITVSTGLAVSSVATNTRVGAGGAFAIISQSLGARSWWRHWRAPLSSTSHLCSALCAGF